MIILNKREIRQKYLQKRRVFSDEKVNVLSQKIFENLKLLDVFSFENFHIFLPIEKNKEVDTNIIIEFLRSKNKTIIVPKTDFANKKMMSFVLGKNTKLTQSKNNILEPKQAVLFNDNDINVVFLPLICFDKNGFRVGYGGGFYDRFLSSIPNVMKIGFSFFEPIDEVFDVDGFDVKMDYCITPSEIFCFKKN